MSEKKKSCNITLNEKLGTGGYGKVYSIKRNGKVDKNSVIKVLHDKKKGDNGKDIYKNVRKFDSLVEIDVLFRFKSTTFVKGLKLYGPGDCYKRKDVPINSVAIELEALKDFKTLIYETNIDNIRKILFIYRIAVAIRCLHRKKILHLDIKPANLLYSDEKDIPYIKISDFGLSHQVDDIELGFNTNISFGSKKYKPPEILSVVRISNDKYKKISEDPHYDDFADKLFFNYTSKFDVWSFGISAIYILDGESMIEDWEEMGYNKFCDTIAEKFSTVNKRDTLEKIILPLKLAKRTEELLMDLLSKVLEINPEKRINFEDITNHRLFSDTMFAKKEPIKEVYSDVDKCGVKNEMICTYNKLKPAMIGGIRYIINIFKGPLDKLYVRDFFFALDIYIRIIIASPNNNWSVCKKTAILATRMAFRYYYPREELELDEHSNGDYAPLEIEVLKLFKGAIRTTNLYDLGECAEHLKVFYDKMIKNNYEGFNHYLVINYNKLFSKVRDNYIIEDTNKIINCKDFFRLEVLSNEEYEKIQPGH